MRAAVVHEFHQPVALEDVSLEDPRAGEVVVRIAASGVCRSDLHLINGRTPVANLPMVLGHEGAGVVEAVGPGVRSVGWALVQAARLHRARTGDRLAKLGLFAGQEQVVQALAAAGTMTMGDLAALLRVRPPTASKTVTRLAALGIVERGAPREKPPRGPGPPGARGGAAVHPAQGGPPAYRLLTPPSNGPARAGRPTPIHPRGRVASWDC